MLKEHTVKQPIIARPVHVLLPLKEMVMFIVPNVRKVCIPGSYRSYVKLCNINILLLAVKFPEPECRLDRDCPQSLVCIQERCQNPCRTNNPCTGNQECQVSSHRDEKKSVACVCPPRYVSSVNGFCKPGKEHIPYLLISDFSLMNCMSSFSARSTRMCNKF